MKAQERRARKRARDRASREAREDREWEESIRVGEERIAALTRARSGGELIFEDELMRKLLALAVATDFPEEAAQALARAQRRYRILVTNGS